MREAMIIGILAGIIGICTAQVRYNEGYKQGYTDGYQSAIDKNSHIYDNRGNYER